MKFKNGFPFCVLSLLFTPCIQGADQPNIIVILADDLGYNDIGYHNPALKTPTLDALAKTGIILEQNYVQPVCTPSRASLMTGMYPYLIGRQGYPISHKQPTGLTLDRRLMPEYLKEKGYATHIVGKWHLGFCNEKYLPTNRGFDSHYGFWGGGQDYWTKTYRHGFDFRSDLNLVLEANNTFSEDLYAERVKYLIKEHAETKPEQPLFLYMPHQATHTPLDPPQEYEDLYRNITDESRRRFLATATVMDDKVASLVQALKDNNMYEDTFILFLGDNGGQPYIGGGGNNWPLRGIKETLYEGGVRTPGFVHYPRLNSTGLVLDHLFHISDWVPTVYHLAGATEQEIADQNFSGMNQWSLLADPAQESLRSEIVINLDDDKGTTFGALRQGKYKYIKNPGLWVGWIPPPELEDGVDEGLTNPGELEGKVVDVLHLYDISTDPEERIDLRHELPHIVEIMNARMEELKVDMVAADNVEEVEGGNEGGIWNSGWC